MDNLLPDSLLVYRTTMRFLGHGQVRHPSPGEGEAWIPMECGHCGRSVSGAVVSFVVTPEGHANHWLQCPTCGEGSVRLSSGRTVPGSPVGPSLSGLPSDVGEAYEEARQCMAVGGSVAAELVCRKILMHVAVEKGAKDGQTFAQYLGHLETEGYVTPPMKKWVDLIRTHGNEATHELAPVSSERAESTLMFTAELLRLTYEMEAMADKYAPAPAGESE